MGNCTGYCTGCKEDYQGSQYARNSHAGGIQGNDSFGGDRNNNEFRIPENQSNSFNQMNGGSNIAYKHNKKQSSFTAYQNNFPTQGYNLKQPLYEHD